MHMYLSQSSLLQKTKVEMYPKSLSLMCIAQKGSKLELLTHNWLWPPEFYQLSCQQRWHENTIFFLKKENNFETMLAETNKTTNENKNERLYIYC